MLHATGAAGEHDRGQLNRRSLPPRLRPPARTWLRLDTQIFQLSSLLELHHGLSTNCQDLVSWLPEELALQIFSYLDPLALCRACRVRDRHPQPARGPALELTTTVSPRAQRSPRTFACMQVCRLWRHFADDSRIWRETLDRYFSWWIPADEWQAIVQRANEQPRAWKEVFLRLWRLQRNWIGGHFTVRTFEGHTSHVSCLQFDDTRIVSGSSDRTIRCRGLHARATRAREGPLYAPDIQRPTLVMGLTGTPQRVGHAHQHASAAHVGRARRNRPLPPV